MSARGLPGHLQRIVDKQCDAFEAAWRDDRQPRIEAFLAGVDARARASLLEELLHLELSLRAEAGGPAPVDDYVARFPEDERLVRQVCATASVHGARTPSTHDSELQLPRGNLLYAVLAQSCGFLSRERLLHALRIWIRDKQLDIKDILLQHQGISPADRQLMDALFARFVERHHGDLQAGLDSLDSLGSLRAELEQLGDAEVSRCLPLAHVESSDRVATGTTRSTLDRTAPLQTRSRLKILRPHAQGGLGQVSIALDEDLRRQVAFKEMRRSISDDTDSRGRFVREAEITGRLEHPGIVPVYGLGQFDDGRPFYAMRFIKGNSLQEAIQQFHADDSGRRRDPNARALALRELLGRFLDVCDAIAYAHSQGVLHRDLKPGNIVLGEYGETLVIDWGLAKSVGSQTDPVQEAGQVLSSDQDSTADTRHGLAIGTPQYMSPEQAEGRVAELGVATDVYALGATLYCLLTGRPPIPRGPLEIMLEQVRQGAWTRPSAIAPHVPRPLESICVKAMARETGQRYASVEQLSADVRRWLGDQQVSAHQESFSERLTRLERRHRTLVRTAVIALMALALVASLAAVNIYRQKQRADLARAESERAKERAERIVKLLADSFRRPDPALDGRTLTVAQLLDQATLEVNQSPESPHVRAELLDALGKTYYGLGLTDEAIKAFESALQLQRDNRETDSLEAADLMNNLAASYHAAGRLQEARDMFAEPLRIRREQLGANHPKTLETINNLAGVLYGSGDVQQALPMFEAALDGYRKHRGADHPDTLVMANNLAVVYGQADRRDKSVPLLQQTLTLARRKLGEDHPTTLLTMHNLAQEHLAAGEFPQALALERKTWELRRDKLGDDHPNTLISLDGLAGMNVAAGQTETGVRLHEECLQRMERILGDRNPQTLVAMNNLAFAYVAANMLDQAVELYERTLTAQREVLGPDHPSTLLSQQNLADAYQKIGRHDQAILLLEEALKQLKARLGDDHPRTLTAISRLAAIRQAQARESSDDDSGSKQTDTTEESVE